MSVSWRSGRNVALLEKWRQLIGHQDITLAKLIQKAVKFPAGPNRPPEAFSHLVDHQYQIARGRIARVLFCVEQGRMVLLHGFVKKTRKTPQRDIDLALKRKKGAGA